MDVGRGGVVDMKVSIRLSSLWRLLGKLQLPASQTTSFLDFLD